jgi:hypothetical protein
VLQEKGSHSGVVNFYVSLKDMRKKKSDSPETIWDHSGINPDGFWGMTGKFPKKFWQNIHIPDFPGF